MSGLFGRSSPPSPPQLPPPPKPEEIMDVIDEITGSQAITVKGANGKKRRVISRLPRTEQEEQIFRQGQELLQSATQNVLRLYQQAPTELVNYQPLVDTFANINEERANDLAEVANMGNIAEEVQAFKDIQKNLLNEEIKRINDRQEQRLIERGHYNSSAGDNLRAQLAREEILAQQQADLNARMYGEQLANQRYQRNLTGYGIREDARQNRMQQAERELALQENQREQLEGQRREAIQNNLSQMQVGSDLIGQDLSRAMATQAPQLGLQQFALANQNQLNHYNANVNRLNTQYQHQMAHYNAKPPSFGETIGRLGMMGAGAALGSFAGGIGSSVGSNVGGMLADKFFPTQKRSH